MVKPTAEELEDLYHGQKKTLQQIAELKGVCNATILHWMRSYGIPRRQRGRPPTGSVNADGYLTFRDAKNNTRVYAHRLEMEKMLGRKLLPNETVHHIDGNKLNNSPSNLQLLSRSYHSHQNWQDPEYRERQTAALQKACRTPDFRERARKNAIKNGLGTRIRNPRQNT